MKILLSVLLCAMSLRQCASLLAVASLLLLQLAAAEFDPAVCSEKCRFVVVPSLGPAGPAGLNGSDGKDGLNGTIDTSISYSGLKLEHPLITGAALSGVIDASSTRFNNLISGSDAAVPCRANTSSGTITFTQKFVGYSSIGALIRWSDGVTSTLTDVAESSSWNVGTISDDITRTDMNCTLVHGTKNFLTTDTHMNGGQLVMHHHKKGAGPRIITLSLDQMSPWNKATWSFPAPPGSVPRIGWAETFVGRDMVQTLSNKTLQSPNVTGLLSITGSSAKLSFGSTLVNCVGNQTGDDLVIETSCSVGYANIGDVIEWADGTIANIVDVAPGDYLGRSWSMTLVRDGGPANRISAPFKLYSARAPGNAATQISPMVTALGGRLVLRGGLSGYGGSSAVSINVFKMDSRNDRHHARWSFPYPGSKSDTSYHLFVGEQTAQTLSNKVLKSPILTGQLRASDAILATSMDPAVCPSWSIAGILRTTSPCDLRARSVGGLVHWSSGQTSRIVQIINSTAATIFELGSTDAVPPSVKRDLDPNAKVHFSTKTFSASHSHTNMQAPTIHDGAATVKLSLAPMAADSITTWYFPATAATDTLVGEQSVQTLSNKILDAAKCNNGLTINSGGLSIAAGGLDVKGGGLSVQFGITVESGGFMVVGASRLFGGLTIGSVGLNIEGTGGLTVQSAGVSFTPNGFNVPAAGLEVKGGGLIVRGGLLTAHLGLDVMNSMSIRGGQLFMRSSTGGINFESGSLTVPAAGLPIKNGGLKFDNMGYTGSDTLNHYEYFSYTATLFGNLAGSIQLEFTRIGRAVTMTIPHFEGIGSSSLVLSLADKSQIPVRFQPKHIAFGGVYKGHRFMIPGIRNNQDVAICVSVLADGNIQFYSGVCGSPWTLSATGDPVINGFYATSVSWITV